MSNKDKKKKPPKVPAELTVLNLGKRVSIYKSVDYADNGEHDQQFSGYLQAFFIHKNGIIIQLLGFDVTVVVKYEYGDQIEVHVID